MAASPPEEAPLTTSNVDQTPSSSNNSSSSSSSSPPASSSAPPPSKNNNPPPPPAEKDKNSSPPPSPPQNSSPSPPKNSSPSPPPPSESSPSPPPPASSSPPPPSQSNSPPPPASTPPPSNSNSNSPSNQSPPPPSSLSSNSPPPPSQSSAPSPPPPSNSSPPSSSTPPPPPTTPSSSSSSPPPPVTTDGSKSPPGAVFPPPLAGFIGSQTPAARGISSGPPGSAGSTFTNKSPGSGGGSPSPSHASATNVAVISGVVGGGVVILALMVCFIIFLRKKPKPKPSGPGYGHPPKGGEQYYAGPDQWNSPHNMKLGAPPGYMGTPGGNVGMWGPPPSAGNASSEFSSGYSGQHMTPRQPPSPNYGAMAHFSHEELAAATGGFSQANLLGQGGFGFVHKGVLPHGREVAVKSLKSGSGQGEREFQAEVEIISRVHHRHLVSLVGYCIGAGQRMLVYEYVPNKTLEFHLHGQGQPVMDWPTRLRIAVGSAKGLAYLHEDCHPRIIHRDIKAANILLDYNFEAMVADFGLAKLTSDNFTHVSTRVMGTFGYLAPEYASSGKLTEKSDVFSFGVMLLELLTGRRPIDLTNKLMEDSLVDWARPLLTKAMENGNFDELVDPRLEGKYDHSEIARLATCAAASIRHSARRRPKMSQIVRALEGDSSLEDLNEGVKPGQSSIYNPNGNAEAYNTTAYNADMDKFRKMVMSSKEFNSSEYASSGEIGQSKP